MNDIYTQINDFNPWHKNQNFRIETDTKSRIKFKQILDYITKKQISVSLSGIRRVGKTTILKQLINYLLSNNVKAKHILYYSFDKNSNDLRLILETYFDSFVGEELYKDKFFIMLDEMQFVKNWQSIVKKYVDLNKKIIFVITGSSNLYIDRDSEESLAGRIIDVKIDVLSFREFIFLKNNQQVDRTFGDFISCDSKEEKLKVLRYLNSFGMQNKKLFRTYLKFGEFPALLQSTYDESFCNTYIAKSVLEKIVRKDLQIFEVQKIGDLEKIMKVVFANTAQIFNKTNIASDMKLASQTVDSYVNILQKAYLINIVRNRLSSIRSQEISQSKVFATSLNFVNSVLHISDPLNPLYLPFKGHIIESYVYNLVKNLGDTFYYNFKEKEVDIVIESSTLEAEDRLIPMEIKSSSKIQKRHISHLRYYMEQNNIEFGYVVYSGDVVDIINFGNARYIFLIPVWSLF